MKIAVLTLYTDVIAEFGELSVRNKRAYAEQHGYEMLVYTETLDRGRHPAWSKLPALKKHLPDYDWIFWTDADSLVMNPERKLDSIIRRGGDREMILTWEAGAAPINTGAWLVRNSPWCAAAVDALMDVRCPSPRAEWYDQGALVGWLEADPARWEKIKVLHPRVMNSTPESGVYADLRLKQSRWRPGDFVIHFWPLGRQVDLITRAMHHYEAISRAPGPFSRSGLRALLHL